MVRRGAAPFAPERPQPPSTDFSRHDLLPGMQALVILALILAGYAAPAAARDHSYANRPQVVFPGPRRGAVHVSPFPMSSRSAAVWQSDECWRPCAANTAWRFAKCIRAAGADACRATMDADDRACLRACRVRGGPYLNITDY